MGRINLAALRVRQKALANVQTGRRSTSPVWADVVGEIPPAQILTRQQPTKNQLLQTRTKSLPNGKTVQQTRAIVPPRPKTAKARHIYSPTQLRYEEDALRSQFFRDHPWELARPRLIVETDGDQHKDADWSTGLRQPGIPVSGESVAQRQLWLLQNIPDITHEAAYDVARKEFYAIRRRQATTMRIAKEEAEMFGADFGVPAMSKGMTKEGEMFDEWVTWAEKENINMMQRMASFAGQQPAAEQRTLQANATESGQSNAPLGSRFGSRSTGFVNRGAQTESDRVGATLAAVIEQDRERRGLS